MAFERTARALLLEASLCLFLLTLPLLASGQRKIAVTIDDLPYADGGCDLSQVISNTETLLAPIRINKVPIVGFVIGEKCQNVTAEERRSILELWVQAGAELGNHTWTHPDLNTVSLDTYEAEILRTDGDLRRLLGSITPRYFRAPYLHDGADAVTKQQLAAFLHSHGYEEAPVTLDNNDWTFASAYSYALKNGNSTQMKVVEAAYIPYMRSNVEFFEKRSVQLFGREIPQVLLIHASRLNAKMMPELLAMYRSRGYQFVSLQEAMSDPVYSTRDGYMGRKGLSWTHRWGLEKGMPVVLEPDEPKWIDQLASGQ
jgi:peptidoglycan/xylan/chitin deacetylase (PgdA/CDA1 family)